MSGGSCSAGTACTCMLCASSPCPSRQLSAKTHQAYIFENVQEMLVPSTGGGMYACPVCRHLLTEYGWGTPQTAVCKDGTGVQFSNDVYAVHVGTRPLTYMSFPAALQTNTHKSAFNGEPSFCLIFPIPTVLLRGFPIQSLDEADR